MMQSLAEESPGVAEVFERGEKALKPSAQGSLKDIVWGTERTLMLQAAAADGNLSACHAYSRHRDDALVSRCGLKPDCGWTLLGEYAACVAAGVMDFEDAPMP